MRVRLHRAGSPTRTMRKGERGETGTLQLPRGGKYMPAISDPISVSGWDSTIAVVDQPRSA
jgi:hypothetical protein